MSDRPSRRLRFEVFRRDNHTCRYCGAKPPDVSLTVDHVVPVALGGRTEPENLVTACTDCNAGKTSIAPDAPIVAEATEDALRWKRAMDIALTAWAVNQTELEEDASAFYAEWHSWTFGSDEAHAPMPTDWRTSVEQWLKVGLTLGDLIRMMDIAFQKRSLALSKRWRYFCGVVWRSLDKIQADAKRLMDEGDG